jgi:hypothetical protein
MEDTENCTIPYHKKHVLFTEFTLNLHDLIIEFIRLCHKIYMTCSWNLQDLFMEFTRFLLLNLLFKLQIRQLIWPKLSIMQAKYTSQFWLNLCL